MSHTSTTKVDQKEYLKKYLSGDKTKKKKKKRDKRYDDSDPNRKVRIIDDDATAFNAGVSDDELMLTGEDAPQIVGEYIETARNKNGDNKWRSINTNKDEVQIKREYSPEDRWGKRTEHKKIKNEISPKYRGRDRSLDISPPRKREKPINPFKQKSSVDLSPTRERNRRRSQDQSPARLNPFKKTARGRSSSADLSPVRNKQRTNSIERKRRAGSADQSPPRFNPFKQTMRGRSPNLIGNSPPRRYEATNRISKDFSPPRKNLKFSNSPRRQQQQQQQQQRLRDFSPMRRPNNSISPRGRFNSRDQHFQHQPQNRFAAKLPIRRKSIDLSPPRKQQPQPHFSPQRERERERQQSNYTRPDNRRQNGANNNNNDRYRSISSGSSNQRRREDSKQRNRSKSLERQRQGPTLRFFNNQRSPERHQNQRFQNQRGPDHYQNSRYRNSPNHRQNQQRSPPRRRDSDQSPPRRRQPSERSESPPSPCIKREKRSPSPRYNERKIRRNDSISPPPTHKPKTVKTLDGKKAGLQDAKSLKEELTARRREEERMFEKMSTELSGRDAEVAVRNTGRHGHRARTAKEEDPEKQRRKEEREKLKKEQYDRWGKGLKQIEDHRARLEEQAHESSKPLARYSNDEDLERHLREQEHADDPMLAYMRRKKKEKQKDSNVPQLPVYQGSYPENRFGIRPGYRWDGVDRSNGYEKKWFDRQNEKHARQEEAYKYSVEDM